MERSSGILMHITSLWGPYGMGDLGQNAYDFLDFLKRTGHSYWQLLPLNPTDKIYKHSPYSTHSAFAGNPLLISPELLEKDGYVDLKEVPLPKGIREDKVIFGPAEEYKEEVLSLAWKQHKKKKSSEPDFENFKKEHAHWLDDYCIYLALREKFGNINWIDWPAELRDREEEALTTAEKELQEPVEKEKFIQFLFFSQWSRLMAEAHHRGVKFFGDVPFYINHDSVDCWVNPSLFKLDEEKKPTHVSGVPPDLFSKTGQLWGTPVYDWKEMKKNDYEWWISRLRQNLLLFDVVRLDHFRAFSAYWEVEASEKTAIRGKWVKTPGVDFFNSLKKEFPEMPFIAEDLGSLDQPVYDLLEKFNFPRMKVLQFAFGDHYRENPYLPFNHLPNDVVYTGTHDNNTSIGWFSNAGKEEKEHLKEYTGMKVTPKNAHKVLYRLALQSVCDLAIAPFQDIIGLGEEALMNIPGSTEGNWTWRVKKEELPKDSEIEEVFKLNELYGRVVQEEEEKEKGDDK
ncbi:4-alpha-glucanotransferase [Salinimicrobium catena]|uniref:4-alpha-glucanotransferase n=1 Tax=Salinimicrobium catena TaxID=390640 RepID=UPI002FE48725